MLTVANLDSVVFTSPTHPDPAKWPFYNGRIVIKASNGEELAVPYFGASTSLLLTSHCWLPLGAAFDLAKEVGDVLLQGPTAEPDPYNPDRPSDIGLDLGYEFTWPSQNITKPAGRLKMAFKLIWGSKLLSMDLFREGWNEPAWRWPPEQSEGFVGSAVLDGATTGIPRAGTWNSNLDGSAPFDVVRWRGAVSNGTLAVGTYQYVYTPDFRVTPE